MYNIALKNGVYYIQEDGKATEPLANSIKELKTQLEDMIKACEEYEISGGDKVYEGEIKRDNRNL